MHLLPKFGLQPARLLGIEEFDRRPNCAFRAGVGLWGWRGGGRRWGRWRGLLGQGAAQPKRGRSQTGKEQEPKEAKGRRARSVRDLMKVWRDHVSSISTDDRCRKMNERLITLPAPLLWARVR